MAYVRTPAEGELEALFSTNADVIRILTLAPEILTPEQLSTINKLKHPNTLLSLGHSNATYQQATEAFNAGIPLATHLYNAMRGFESREPGVVGAVFDHPTFGPVSLPIVTTATQPASALPTGCWAVATDGTAFPDFGCLIR